MLNIPTLKHPIIRPRLHTVMWDTKPSDRPVPESPPSFHRMQRNYLTPKLRLFLPSSCVCHIQSTLFETSQQGYIIFNFIFSSCSTVLKLALTTQILRGKEKRKSYFSPSILCSRYYNLNVLHVIIFFTTDYAFATQDPQHRAYKLCVLDLECSQSNFSECLSLYINSKLLLASAVEALRGSFYRCPI